MEKDDSELIFVRNKRNELENYIYQTRNKLSSELFAYVTDEENVFLLKLMEDLESWLYSGDSMVENLKGIEDKSKRMLELSGIVYKRSHENKKVDKNLKMIVDINALD